MNMQSHFQTQMWVAVSSETCCALQKERRSHCNESVLKKSLVASGLAVGVARAGGFPGQQTSTPAVAVRLLSAFRVLKGFVVVFLLLLPRETLSSRGYRHRRCSRSCCRPCVFCFLRSWSLFPCFVVVHNTQFVHSPFQHRFWWCSLREALPYRWNTGFVFHCEFLGQKTHQFCRTSTDLWLNWENGKWGALWQYQDHCWVLESM